MRKMLGIVAMLVATLIVSADLPRAGPNDRIDNVVTVTEVYSVTDLIVNESNTVIEFGFAAVSALDTVATVGLRREEVVHQNPTDAHVLRAKNRAGVSGYLTIFRDTHRPLAGHPLLT